MRRLVVDARLAGHSGIGTYLAEVLPRVLPRLERWRPLVLTLPAQRQALASLPGADLETWPVTPLSARDLVSAPPAVGRDDLLWTPHFNVPLRGSVPLAVTLHDLMPLTEPKLAGAGRSHALRAFLRAIRQRARIVLCVSEFTRGEAIRVGGLDPLRTRVARLGVNAAWSARGADAGAAPGGPPTIIFVGLLKPHKNVYRLLQAFAAIRDRIAHRLVLVARHHSIRYIDRKALDLARTLSDRVALVEDLSFANLVARVRSAQIAVQPSLHEGFGLPALEAMAAGVPLLAARAGAMPEVCGDAALYCDPHSIEDIARGLLRIAGDDALRARLTEAGRARAAMYSWDACAQATAEALEMALRNGALP